MRQQDTNPPRLSAKLSAVKVINRKALNRMVSGITMTCRQIFTLGKKQKLKSKVKSQKSKVDFKLKEIVKFKGAGSLKAKN
ncbi:hypothetical protein Sps_01482 [Shewanella psychrophila]|uniref:Uncharacterized protein n=1 Tax=Shewanella psychrophila TaxID=225848 RepID=A0A1S6HMD1_9GAMM|nr:hypothetical protein Sps_01482 [Shewanella psychrophila]